MKKFLRRCAEWIITERFSYLEAVFLGMTGHHIIEGTWGYALGWLFAYLCSLVLIRVNIDVEKLNLERAEREYEDGHKYWEQSRVAPRTKPPHNGA